MTSEPIGDEQAFADLLDDLVDGLLNGSDPDLQAAAVRHPLVADRVREAWQLACGVVGRHETARPSLSGYTILRELGRGGMGTVYLARQEQLDREVALKVLPHSFGLSARSRQAFLDEAKALARVRHPNIVTIFRIVDDQELLAFEMEFIDGPSLQHVLTHLREVRERTGVEPNLQHVADFLQLPVEALAGHNLTKFFVHITQHIARALGAVHAAGFVHRDVKPANILLRKNGTPVLADFGLVRDTALERTQKTGFAGTPVYSSPEQLRGDAPIGAAADVYALGVTLYECLTLTPPFAGRTTTDLLHRIESGRVPPLRQLAPQAPRDLETIVEHAMDLSPEQRYSNGEALADDLQRLLELQPIQARRVGVVRRAGKFLRRNRLPLVAGCVGAILVAGAMLLMLEHAQAASRDTTAAQKHVHSARQALLSPDCRRTAWQNATRTTLGRPTVAGNQATLAALRSATTEYDLALAKNPNDTNARSERAVAQMLLWLRELTLVHVGSLAQAMATAEYELLAKALPPNTRAVAQATATGRLGQLDPGTVLAECDANDRICLGLWTFLVGEFHWSEVAWNDAVVTPVDQPLRDAALGLINLSDGAAERAYVQLESAQRAMPDAAFALELAEAALAMGESELAAGWLAQAPRRADVHYGRRLEADLQLANGRADAAENAYRELARDNPFDPTPIHRLAQLTLRSGDLGRAAAILDDLLALWPDVARFRLDRARIALQQRDVAAYLRQALAVMTKLAAVERASASADRLEVLRIGGLMTVHRRAIESIHGARNRHTVLGGELPLRAILPCSYVDRLEQLLPLLAEFIHRERGAERGNLALDPATGLLLVWMPLAMARLPGLTNQLTLPQRVACEASAWLARARAPGVLALLRSMAIRLLPTNWSALGAQQVPLPSTLAGSHVIGSTLLRGADWNGDGIAEVLVGCKAARGTIADGRVCIVDGRRATILAEVASGTASHLFGHSLAVVGDVDGDGLADWLAGAPAATQQTRRGYVELRSTRRQQCIARIDGDSASFGVAGAGVGDWDGDGCPDFAVGAPPLLSTAASHGNAFVYSGRTRDLLKVLSNDVAGAWFGATLADLGDTNGDGVHDLAVGGNFGNAPGVVRLFAGGTGSELAAWSDAMPTSGFGARVTAIGDVNDDGVGDVAISAIRNSSDQGLDQVHLYSGRTGAMLRTIFGKSPGIGFGTSVVRFERAAPEGPLLAIGASLGGHNAVGRIEFWEPLGQQVAMLHGPGPFSEFGSWIAATEDVDGDGHPELFVSCPRPGTASLMRVDSLGFRLAR